MTDCRNIILSILNKKSVIYNLISLTYQTFNFFFLLEIGCVKCISNTWLKLC